MSEIDRHGKLEAEPFSFRLTKDRKVFIHWNGKQIMILKGTAAEKFLASIDDADAQQTQLEMARVTGHFKHGTERNDPDHK
ncbi:MAG: hypothetical protein HGA86_05900 [Anaerolineaceae bacterium]|nr:hypothetical protein [Anaerolineaceae bacterium]